MIVRVLGRGQFDVADETVDELNRIDDAIEQAVAAADQAALTSALTELVTAVRERGTPVADAELVDSDLILPGPDASLADVHAMLGDEGLVPDA